MEKKNKKIIIRRWRVVSSRGLQGEWGVVSTRSLQGEWGVVSSRGLQFSDLRVLSLALSAVPATPSDVGKYVCQKQYIKKYIK